MAMDMGIENASGVVVAYWKVTGLNLAFTGKRGAIMLGGYLSKETRDADKEQVQLKQVNIQTALYDEYFSLDKLNTTNCIELAYNYLLAVYEEFLDAELI